jgi:hypothetical protein
MQHALQGSGSERQPFARAKSSGALSVYEAEDVSVQGFGGDHPVVRYHHDGAPQPASLPPPNIDDVPRVAFADLEPWHCRYPVGDPQSQEFGFCGLNREVGTSYCPAHVHRCTGHPEPKTRQSVPTVQPVKELVEA